MNTLCVLSQLNCMLSDDVYIAVNGVEVTEVELKAADTKLTLINDVVVAVSELADGALTIQKENGRALILKASGDRVMLIKAKS